MLSPEDARLIDHLHGGFPLVDHPFAAVAADIGWTEEQVIERLHRLLAQGVLTRFGPLFQIERAGGQFVLAAMAVPEDRFDAVCAAVNAFTEVAHNYRREHALNMWFVVAAESPAAGARDPGTHRSRDWPAGLRLSQGRRVFRGVAPAAPAGAVHRRKPWRLMPSTVR